MMIRHSFARLARVVALGAVGLTWAPSVQAAGVPDGEYDCYVFFLMGNVTVPNLVGTLQTKGSTYAATLPGRNESGQSGQYVFEPAGQVLDFKGPPLGFKVGVLEVDNGRKEIRLYPERKDIGNKWGALLCSPKT